MAVLYGIDELSILVPSRQKLYSRFLKKASVFQEMFQKRLKFPLIVI